MMPEIWLSAACKLSLRVLVVNFAELLWQEVTSDSFYQVRRQNVNFNCLIVVSALNSCEMAFETL